LGDCWVLWVVWVIGFKSLNDFSTVAHVHGSFDLYQLLYLLNIYKYNNNTYNPKS